MLKNPISTGLNIFAWLFIRLPLGFSLPFTALSLAWVFGGFRLANDRLATPLAAAVASFLEAQLPKPIGAALISDLQAFVHAGMIIVLFALGFIVAYNVSAFLNWILVISNLKPVPDSDGPPQVADEAPDAPSPLRNIERIGIVLAGGGAKGAYQAGAMKAIYRFLAQHGALGKVRVISGTSIGSWNALFWLGNLIKPANDWNHRSVHERWWRSISAKSLTAPSWYVPFFRNAFLSSLPWQQDFDRLFGREDVKQQLLASTIHFYLTRSDVRTGQLECVTNNPAPPKIQRVTYETLNPRGNEATFIDGVKAGVFASMDLPPLFPYALRNNRQFEDGGVIDNLPITFPAIEGCDLIFILPLNSDFEEQPNRHSVLARLLRVMDVRQGVLERSGFKMLYLYNELAALRRQVAAVAPEVPAAAVAQAEIGRASPLISALQRRNELINVFAICPLKSFVEETIDTRELWKRKEAGVAFEVMGNATAGLLPNFDFQPQDAVRVALVGRGGNITWDEQF
jgi:NTE family protein